MRKSKNLTYSQALNELEKIVSSIESEEIDVDLLAEKVKRATFLIKTCKGRLKSADDEVRKILSEGEPKQGAEGPAEKTSGV